MNICLQNTNVKPERDLNNVVVSVRLKNADAVRFWRSMDAAKHRNPYIDRSDVIRELMGLDPPSCVTPIKRFKLNDARGKRGLFLVPANDDYSPRELLPADEAEIVGTVTSIIKRL